MLTYTRIHHLDSYEGRDPALPGLTVHIDRAGDEWSVEVIPAGVDIMVDDSPFARVDSLDAAKAEANRLVAAFR